MPEKNTILLIGKNSFIGQTYAKLYGVTAISHDDPELDTQLASHETIINFAYHPDLYKNEYNAAKDIDTQIAKKLTSSQRLVVISSRAVYGPSDNTPFKETDLLKPSTAYARNKAMIEENCLSLLGDRALILRLSNIFGFEWSSSKTRHTFMGHVLSSMKAANRMIFDIAETSEKDFLAVEDCCCLIHELIGLQASGIFNVALGQSIPLRNLTNALISGYGNCTTSFTTSRIDSFYIDIAKLSALGVQLPTMAATLDSITDIGRKLSRV